MKDNFDSLIKDISSCRECKKLFGFEPNPVFGGHKNAKIVQISQAPSKNVHKTSKSFNDASGRKLRKEWYKISDEDFYNEKNFYITGIGHCYPGKSPNGGDRVPPKKCADKWLKDEIRLINNTLYVIIGRHAAKYFFPNQELTKLAFNNQKINNKLAIVLPHPSPLNQKWFKDNPEFQTKRLPEIRKIIHKVLRP